MRGNDTTNDLAAKRPIRRCTTPLRTVGSCGHIDKRNPI